MTTPDVEECMCIPCPRCDGAGSVSVAGSDPDVLVTLSPRRARFVIEVVRGSSYAAAARAAGYSPHSSGTTGSRLMRVPAVSRAVRVLLEETDLAVLDPSGVARRIDDAAGNGNAFERVRALELLARAAGLYDGRCPEVVDWDPRRIAWAADEIASSNDVAPGVRLRALALLARIAGLDSSSAGEGTPLVPEG